MKKITSKASFPVLFAVVLAILPQSAQAVTIISMLGSVSAFINMLIPIFLALAVLAFFWGLVKWLFTDPGNAEKRSEAINIMGMGVIVIFVMVSLWGLIAVLQRTTVFKRNNGIFKVKGSKKF